MGAVDKVASGVMVRIRARFNSLTELEKQVSYYVSAHPDKVIHMSLAELAKEAGVSDATALRFARSIGFSGFNDMKLALVADTLEPVEAVFEEIQDEDDVPTITKKVFRSCIEILQDSVDTLDMDALAEAIEKIQEAQFILIFAVGLSIPLAHYINNRLMRLGYRVSVVTDVYLQLTQAALVKKGDVVLALSRSGISFPLVKATRTARERGAFCIAFTCNDKSPVAQSSNLKITAVSREIRAEVMTSPVALSATLDALYAGLVMSDKTHAVQFERDIWEAMAPMRARSAG